MNIIAEQHKEMALRLAKPGEDILKSLTPEDCHLIHMGGCLTGEAAELLECFDENDNPHEENLVEELGDWEFYFVVCCDIFGCDPQTEVKPENEIEQNIVGLMKAGGDFWDVIKRIVIYRKDWNAPDKKFDNKTLFQVGQDLLANMRWYANEIYASIPPTRDEVLKGNIQKLDGARYRSGFYSDAQAISRTDKVEVSSEFAKGTQTITETLNKVLKETTQRKVIQLSSVIDSVGKYLVLCVCNDGTIWKLHGLYEGNPKWELFVQPPQS